MALFIAKFAILLLAFLPFQQPWSSAQTWIKSGYWFSNRGLPITDINSTLYTHLICAFSELNLTTYQLSVSSSDNPCFSAFTSTVKLKNPSVITHLSIGGDLANYSVYSSMVGRSSHRKSFIDSSIKTARLYGFDGLDFCWFSANTSSDMTNLANLLGEWRTAIESESRNSSNNNTQLILTMGVLSSPYLDATDFPYLDATDFPVESIRNNLNWVHVLAMDYYMPKWDSHTGAHAALYDPGSVTNTDYGINSWIISGLSADKLVLGLPFYGYAWTLVNPSNSEIGALAKGPAITEDGFMTYKEIKEYIQRYGGVSMYNATYEVNYCTIGSTWIGFDDVEVVKKKVAYAKKRNLLGYSVWQVAYDDNWVLSQAAQEEEKDHQNKRKRPLLLIILLPTAAIVLILLGSGMWYRRRKLIISISKEKNSQSKMGTTMATAGSTDAPNLQVFSFGDIKAATNDFSFENKLGEGGYGPVYKGRLKGQEIAAKRLSKASKQGFEEFKNEVILTAKLQHINLVRVLGFCTEREEKMLIYEYMPNKSLDFYIYDPIRRLLLDWGKRARIIEGVTQGLLYLQDYSRLTVIHRDLKPGNILLDNEMKAKISDFGMARTFHKDEFEANTSRRVGTYGYVPPEYVKHGTYSIKSDVFSFGVLLLQIISGKQNSCLHGPLENLNLLEYAYELWNDGKGIEFMDPPLDDTTSSCKLMRCMLVALLCVQENPMDRPSMLEVSSMLKNETMAITSPKRPAFSTKSNGDAGNASNPQQENWSVDKATITQMEAR